MKPRCWPEQILRLKQSRLRSSGVAGHQRNRPHMIRSCSARWMWLLRWRCMGGAEVSPLEERIGYKFRNSLLLAEALTHPSLGHETQRFHFDNQRLEFLGDAVLQLVITEYLFSNFQIEAEGQLTKFRSRLVSRDALRTHAAALDLGRYILMGRGEEASGGRERTSTLADAFEALIGALYLDGGLDVARHFILTQTRTDLAKLAEEPVDFNPKGDLQELVQSISPRSPVYELVSQSGPEHEKTFVSEVVWEGIVLGQG